MITAGHHVAGCDDDDRFNGVGIVVGERYFVPNYGYTINVPWETGKRCPVKLLLSEQLTKRINRHRRRG